MAENKGGVGIFESIFRIHVQPESMVQLGFNEFRNTFFLLEGLIRIYAIVLCGLVGYLGFNPLLE